MSAPSIDNRQSAIGNRAKLRGGGNSELTKFKELWRDTLSEDSKEHLRSLFVSQSTQAQIRSSIANQYNIKLHRDDQLNAFRDWELDQRQRDLEAERMEEDQRRALEEHPDWTLAQAREDVLTKAMMRAGTVGDFKLGFEAIREDRATNSAKFKGELESAKLELSRMAEARQHEELGLSRDKFELLKRKADAYDRAQAALTEAKNSTGGITPETLTKIERELKLL